VTCLVEAKFEKQTDVKEFMGAKVLSVDFLGIIPLMPFGH
jgi:hypothetical protein